MFTFASLAQDPGRALVLVPPSARLSCAHPLMQKTNMACVANHPLAGVSSWSVWKTSSLVGRGLLARVDDTADEATTDEGWDGEVALLEDALRYARMVSVAYGHLVSDPMMFPDLDTSSGSTKDSSRAQVVQEKHWRLSSTDFLGMSKNDIQYMRIRVRRSCQCFFLILTSVALSCSWSERVQFPKRFVPVHSVATPESLIRRCV